MKRRDFIKGLVAAPVVLKGVEAVAKPKKLYMFGESTVENHGFGLAPVKAEGAIIEYDIPRYSHSLKEIRRRYKEGTNSRGLRLHNNCSWKKFYEAHRV